MLTEMLTEIRPIELSPKLFKRSDLALCIKISVGYDIKQISGAVSQITDQCQMYKKDQIKGYTGLSLHYSDPNNIYADGLLAVNKKVAPQLFRGSFRYFDKPNEYGKKFAFIQNTFSKISLVRGRILMAKPGTTLPWHTDWPMGWRLHLPIVTYEGATIDFREKSYHLPADGNCYLINGECEHQMRNLSSETRVHIVYEVMTYKSFNDLKTQSLTLASSLNHG